MTDEPKTKFEADLKQFFPDIYRLNSIGKWDKFFWDAIDSMLKMVDENSSGEITIRYNSGRIDSLYRKENLLFGRSKDPNLSKTSDEEK
jgi:hypothetical protein